MLAFLKESLSFLLFPQHFYRISELEGAFGIFEAEAFISSYICKLL